MPGEQHDKESFQIGAVAVTNAEKNKKTIFNKIGGFAITKTDLKLLEPGETVVTIVRRHPIGIIGIYIEMLTGILLVIGLVVLAVIGFFVSISSQTKGLVAAMGLFVVAFLVVILFVSTYVYRQCRLIVTDKSVVQILQRALFNRRISRLSMSNVEDVNVEQKGVLTSIFNYGTLIIQTAGEVDNFVFPFCPTPDKYANQILEARQNYVRDYSEERAN